MKLVLIGRLLTVSICDTDILNIPIYENVDNGIKQWASDTIERLQGCFETTQSINLIAPSYTNEHMDTV